MKKRFISFALTFVILCFSFVLPVSAVQDCSLHLICKYNDTPIASAKASIYRIADYRGGNNLQLLDKFAEHSIAVDVSTSEKLDTTAFSVYTAIKKDGIEAEKSSSSDENGKINFSELDRGYYLVEIDRIDNPDGSSYSFAPFIIVLPEFNDTAGKSSADVTAYPKASYNKSEETIDISVVIIWNDDGMEDERPNNIKINLLCDGLVADSVILNDENNWKYEWKNKDASHKWLVVEESCPDGYSIVEKEEPVHHFEIIHAPQTETAGPVAGGTAPYTEKVTMVPYSKHARNESPAENVKEVRETPTKVELPMTGQFWWPVPVLFAIGFIIIITGVSLRRKNEE